MSTNDTIEIVDIICEFFEVAIHNILYTRKVYPESIFVRKKKYGVLVHKSEHPLLNEYIAQSLIAVHYHAKANQLRRLNVSITAQNRVIESYVFDVVTINNNHESDPLLLKLKEDMRAFCLKLSVTSVYLGSLPTQSEFRIELCTTAYSVLAFNEDSKYSEYPWISVNSRDSNSSPDIVPVHTVNAENFQVQMYVEKFKH